MKDHRDHRHGAIAPGPIEDHNGFGRLGGPPIWTVKALSKAHRLRYHQHSPSVFTRYPAEFDNLRGFPCHAVAAIDADTAAMGATVRSGLRALLER
jgi:hypothetical protein